MMIHREMKITEAYHEFLRTWGIGAYEARTMDFLRKGTLFHIHYDTGLEEDDKRKGIRKLVLDVSLPIAEAWTIFSEINNRNYGAEEINLQVHKKLVDTLKEIGASFPDIPDCGYHIRGSASPEVMERLAADNFKLLGDDHPVDAGQWIWIGNVQAERADLTIRRGMGYKQADRLMHTMQAPLTTFMEKLGNIEESIEKWEEVYHSEKTE
jgi:hypothetical protein